MNLSAHWLANLLLFCRRWQKFAAICCPSDARNREYCLDLTVAPAILAWRCLRNVEKSFAKMAWTGETGFECYLRDGIV